MRIALIATVVLCFLALCADDEEVVLRVWADNEGVKALIGSETGRALVDDCGFAKTLKSLFGERFKDVLSSVRALFLYMDKNSTVVAIRTGDDSLFRALQKKVKDRWNIVKDKEFGGFKGVEAVWLSPFYVLGKDGVCVIWLGNLDAPLLKRLQNSIRGRPQDVPEGAVLLAEAKGQSEGKVSKILDLRPRLLVAKHKGRVEERLILRPAKMPDIEAGVVPPAGSPFPKEDIVFAALLLPDVATIFLRAMGIPQQAKTFIRPNSAAQFYLFEPRPQGVAQPALVLSLHDAANFVKTLQKPWEVIRIKKGIYLLRRKKPPVLLVDCIRGVMVAAEAAPTARTVLKKLNNSPMPKELQPTGAELATAYLNIPRLLYWLKVLTKTDVLPSTSRPANAPSIRLTLTTSNNKLLLKPETLSLSPLALLLPLHKLVSQTFAATLPTNRAALEAEIIMTIRSVFLMIMTHKLKHGRYPKNWRELMKDYGLFDEAKLSDDGKTAIYKGYRFTLYPEGNGPDKAIVDAVPLLKGLRRFSVTKDGVVKGNGKPLED